MNADPNSESADDSRAGDEGALPHDRDEKPTAPNENAQHRHNRQPMAQAHGDIEAGLQDTERLGTPNDVPSADRNAGERR